MNTSIKQNKKFEALTSENMSSDVRQGSPRSLPSSLTSSKRPRLQSPEGNRLRNEFEKSESTLYWIMEKSEGSFSNDSPFLIDRELKLFVGNVNSVKKMKDKLLIEVRSIQQASKIVTIQHFCGYKVSVYPHKSLNFSKGVVTCADLLNCTLDEISTELASQGVIGVKRMMTKRNGEFVNTSSLLLTFNRPKIPEKVKAGFYSLPVRLYIPSPLRCYRCQRFGHTAERCNKDHICVCGDQIHEGYPCRTPINCVNCSGNHLASSKMCPAYKDEVSIQRVKVEQKLSYIEAKRLVKSNKPTYAKVLSRQNGEPPDIKHIISELLPEITRCVESTLRKQIYYTNNKNMTEQNKEKHNDIAINRTHSIDRKNSPPVHIRNQDNLLTPDTSRSRTSSIDRSRSKTRNKDATLTVSEEVTKTQKKNVSLKAMGIDNISTELKITEGNANTMEIDLISEEMCGKNVSTPQSEFHLETTVKPHINTQLEKCEKTSSDESLISAPHRSKRKGKQK